jgi:hypothetical protein
VSPLYGSDTRILLPLAEQADCPEVLLRTFRADWREFASDEDVAMIELDTKTHNAQMRFLLWTFSVLLAFALMTASGLAAGAQLGKAPPERAPVIMVGDRLVNVAYHLGVVPEAMSIRGDLWPSGVALAKATSTLLGCPFCIVNRTPDIVPATLRQKQIDTVLVEKSVPFDLTKPQRDPMDLPPFLEEKGVLAELGTKIVVIDFTAGLDAAIRQIGDVLDRKDQAEALIANRAQRMVEVTAALPSLGERPRVLVLDGTSQAGTGKTFVRIHLPGGYIDDFLLAPLGAENVGTALTSGGENGFAALPRLDGLGKAAPDLIVMTGDADAVQRKLFEALARNPDLVQAVPAIAHQAILALPAYYDSEVITYPDVLERWGAAFASILAP